MKNLTEQGCSLTAAAQRSLLGLSKRDLCYIACVYDTELKSIAETDLRALRSKLHHCRP